MRKRPTPHCSRVTRSWSTLLRWFMRSPRLQVLLLLSIAAWGLLIGIGALVLLLLQWIIGWADALLVPVGPPIDLRRQ